MKLRNKKTGELGIPRVDYQEFYIDTESNTKRRTYCYKTLDAMFCEWEDYTEEPKERWFIDPIAFGYVDTLTNYSEEEKGNVRELGLDFETKEKAEKAVEKLKAWKRLRNHNLRIERGQRVCANADNCLTAQKPLFVMDTYNEVEDDLDLLFGGEE